MPSLFSVANLMGGEKRGREGEKGIDKGERIWYSNKAVGAAGSRGRQEGGRRKELEKKVLTNGKKSGIIAMFRRERRAPCKLNNVTKRKHQKVIPFRWYDQRTMPFCRVESITGGMGK